MNQTKTPDAPLAAPTASSDGQADRVPSRRRTRRTRALLLGGLALVLLAALLRFVLVPMLLKLPTNIDVTAHYAGAQELFVNPKNGQPLAQPLKLPLQINRHVKADPSLSTGSRVAIDETIVATVKGGGTLHESNRYVMDRKSTLNVTDPKAYAFTPSNVVDRAGAYRLSLPFGLAQGTRLKIYSNDTNSVYEAYPDRAQPTGSVDGLGVLNYTANQQPHALSPVYLAGLEASAGLPKSTTLKALEPGLKAAGIDLGAIVGALPAADQARIAAQQGQPIPLLYDGWVNVRFTVEPTTGSIVSVPSEVDTVSVRPDPTALAPLAAILAQNSAKPVVASALPKLPAVAAQSQPVFALAFSQTASSVKQMRDKVDSARLQVMALKLYIPIALLVLGLLGLALGLRARKRAR